MILKRKLTEWSKRYVPAELAAIIGTLAGGVITHNLFNNPVLTSIGATWGENLGFYSWILYIELRALSKLQKKFSLVSLIKTVRNIAIEFGPGELVDSFIIRPAAMYTMPLLVQNLAVGLVLGKLTADGAFYCLTISALEVRKKYFHN